MTRPAVDELRELANRGSFDELVRRLTAATPAELSDPESAWNRLMRECVASRNWQVVDRLFHGGMSVSTPDTAGRTPLMLAAETGYSEDVLRLLEYGATIDATDQFGWTALFYAAKRQHAATVKVLLDAGADSLHLDVEGSSAADIARRWYFGFRVPLLGFIVNGALPLRPYSSTAKLIRRASANEQPGPL